MKFIIGLSLVFSSVSFSASLYDVTMPDQQIVLQSTQSSVGGTKLNLKGMGRRELSILGIQIRPYIAGLYVADTKQTCPDIVKSAKTKMVEMDFLMHVPARELASNLKEGVEKNCLAHCEEQKEKVKQIKEMVPSPGSGDKLKITFDDKGTSFALNDKTLGRVEGIEFAQTLISAFIVKPPNESLKEGLCK